MARIQAARSGREPLTLSQLGLLEDHIVTSIMPIKARVEGQLHSANGGQPSLSLVGIGGGAVQGEYSEVSLSPVKLSSPSGLGEGSTSRDSSISSGMAGLGGTEAGGVGDHFLGGDSKRDTAETGEPGKILDEGGEAEAEEEDDGNVGLELSDAAFGILADDVPLAGGTSVSDGERFDDQHDLRVAENAMGIGGRWDANDDGRGDCATAASPFSPQPYRRDPCDFLGQLEAEGVFAASDSYSPCTSRVGFSRDFLTLHSYPLHNASQDSCIEELYGPAPMVTLGSCDDGEEKCGEKWSPISSVRVKEASAGIKAASPRAQSSASRSSSPPPWELQQASGPAPRELDRTRATNMSPSVVRKDDGDKGSAAGAATTTTCSGGKDEVQINVGGAFSPVRSGEPQTSIGCAQDATSSLSSPLNGVSEQMGRPKAIPPLSSPTPPRSLPASSSSATAAAAPKRRTETPVLPAQPVPTGDAARTKAQDQSRALPQQTAAGKTTKVETPVSAAVRPALSWLHLRCCGKTPAATTVAAQMPAASGAGGSRRGAAATAATTNSTPTATAAPAAVRSRTAVAAAAPATVTPVGEVGVWAGAPGTVAPTIGGGSGLTRMTIGPARPTKRKRSSSIPSALSQPREVNYQCGECGKSYSASVSGNPWWALVRQECPECHKTQIPRIDILNPTNNVDGHVSFLTEVCAEVRRLWRIVKRGEGGVLMILRASLMRFFFSRLAVHCIPWQRRESTCHGDSIGEIQNGRFRFLFP